MPIDQNTSATAGDKAPNFRLFDETACPLELQHFPSMNFIINVYPTLESAEAQQSLQAFQQWFANKEDKHLVALVVSLDLPPALARITQDLQKTDHLYITSDYQQHLFGKAFGLIQQNQPHPGLLQRAVIAINSKKRICSVERLKEKEQESTLDRAYQTL